MRLKPSFNQPITETDMQTLDKFLETDHKQCDLLLEQAHEAAANGDWSAADAALRAFAASLLRHISMEEDVLFPAFEQAAGSAAGPTAVMRSEHGHLRGLIESATSAARARDEGLFFAEFEALQLMLGQHNLKEENVLYPMVARLLAARTGELLAAMQKPVRSQSCCGQCGATA